MRRIFFVWTALILFFGAALSAQSVDPDFDAPMPLIFSGDSALAARMTPDQRARQYLTAEKILWQTGTMEREGELLEKPLGQTSTSEMTGGFYIKKDVGAESAILLDFGAEIHGGVRLEARNLTSTPESVGKSVRVRVRLGESADEAMAEMGEKGAVNEHSTRDMIVNVPWLGAIEFGESAFRFVRIDLIDDGSEIWFDSIRAVFVYRPISQPGNFCCSDERLNAIWRTCARTQFLTMQGFIFEGAKRDRLVWYGDFHPQLSTTLALFGAPVVLKETLGDYARSVFPLPKWMNGMPNYSLWWVMSVGDLYRWSGDTAWLAEQADYLHGLFEQLKSSVADDGHARFDHPFLDWPTNDKPEALDAGTHALFALAFDRFAALFAALGDTDGQRQAEELAKKVRSFTPDNVANKQAASLMALAKIENPSKPNTPVVAKNGGEGFSTFYGYYMLEALAAGGENQLALDVIRQYWGAMLDVGATTFWEDFDLAWLENAGRIDQITPEGKESLHGDRGAYCYIGLRHSLCHGWASGPAAWLTAHVLGVAPTSDGYATAKIEPFLGDLQWAEGDVPTPRGVIHVRHEKTADGTILTTVEKPDEISIP